MVKNIITAAIVALLVVAVYHFALRGVFDQLAAKKTPALPART